MYKYQGRRWRRARRWSTKVRAQRKTAAFEEPEQEQSDSTHHPL